jgi:hypothetical protein
MKTAVSEMNCQFVDAGASAYSQTRRVPLNPGGSKLGYRRGSILCCLFDKREFMRLPEHLADSESVKSCLRITWLADFFISVLSWETVHRFSPLGGHHQPCGYLIGLRSAAVGREHSAGRGSPECFSEQYALI